MEHIMLKRGFKHHKIQLEDIHYIESRNKKIAIHTKSGVAEYYHKIQDVEAKLDATFFRCHRCYIVNLGYVTGYSSSAVRLETGAEIPLSRRRCSRIANALKAYAENASLA